MISILRFITIISLAYCMYIGFDFVTKVKERRETILFLILGVASYLGLMFICYAA